MTTPETQEVESVGLTEEQATSKLLEKWGASDDKDESPEPEDDGEEQDSEPQAEQSAEDDAEAEEKPEEEGEESGDVEIDVGGEKFKLPPAIAEQAKRIEAKVKEIEAGTTRKFQEAAEIRKTAEAQVKAAQELQQIAHTQADLIADHKMVERRLDALSRMDINALAESDPVQLTRINAEYNQLQAAKQRIEQQYRQSVAESQKLTTEQHQAKVQKLADFAKSNIKGWSDAYSNTLLEFSVNTLGFAPDKLRELINEPLMRAIDLAYQGHKVRTAQPKDKQVTTTKTLKPGAAAQVKTNAHMQAEKARQRLKKSGSMDDAVMALLARSNARKR